MLDNQQKIQNTRKRHWVDQELLLHIGLMKTRTDQCNGRFLLKHVKNSPQDGHERRKRSDAVHHDEEDFVLVNTQILFPLGSVDDG